MAWLVRTDEVRMRAAGNSITMYMPGEREPARTAMVSAETIARKPARTKFAPSTSRRLISADSIRIKALARM
jgi:hypothetical protein